MNILVHSENPNIVPALRDIYSANYSVQEIFAHALASQPWQATCALLVSSIWTRTIESYVDQGGSFLAFSAQPTPSKICAFGTPMDVPAVIRFSDGDVLDGVYRPATEPHLPKSAHILATLEKSNLIAGIKCTLGLGTLILWSVAIGPNIDTTRELLRKSAIHIPLQQSSHAPIASNPLPQNLTSTHPALIRKISDSLVSTYGDVLEDANDSFQLHTSTPTEPLSPTKKHIIFCYDGHLPETPLFNISAYFSELASARGGQGSPATTNDSWGFGELLLYGQAVTSTQTMLDKNPKFLSSLPTPLVSLASHQLSGRGRGSNVWLSPSGCLQFSLLLRVSLSTFPASKIVFIQYLFALAVTEACRDERVMGPDAGNKVRLKWPNDIYAVSGTGERAKIGGILVNTSFTGGVVDVIIGCGLNVLNPPPITSLSQLTARSLSMEATAAVIMTIFESMWMQCLEAKGSFDSFMNLYLERWLHSDQLVTLTTVAPPKSVRIVGITSDHGLLRTLPEKSGWGGRDEGFIDLQPDGNSFDLMSGLIKTKK